VDKFYEKADEVLVSMRCRGHLR